MDKEELKQYLIDNLKISQYSDNEWDGDNFSAKVSVYLSLDGELVSNDYVWITK